MLGIAESFLLGQGMSTLAGIIVRRDGLIDGIVYGRCTIEGDDATQVIVQMLQSLERHDINCIMIDGLIISMYNIIDGHLIMESSGIPVIAVTFEETAGIEHIIRDKFGQGSDKMENYHKIGNRERVSLWTGKGVFVRYWGINEKTAAAILNSFTNQGAVPEPIRIAKIAARAVSRMH